MAGGKAAPRCYAAVCRPAIARRCSFGTSALLWIAVTALSILLPLLPARAVLSQDGQILLSFADEMLTTYGSNFNMESWNESGSDACAWMGVLCGPDSTVVRLDLSSWDIHRANVKKLSSLGSLKELDLSGNRGASFYGLETLSGLTRLDLSDTLAQNLYDFVANRSGDLPIRHLFADRCRPPPGGPPGTLPSLQALSNLMVLSLSDNGMTGGIPDQVRNLVNLTLLDLSYNQLSGGVSDLEGLTSLTQLILDGNSLTGIMAPPPKLQYLTAGANNFTRLAPSFLQNSNLRHVNMSWNRLEGPLAPLNTNISAPELHCLDMSWNRLSGSIPWGFGDLMVYLDLSNNNLSGAIPSDLDAKFNRPDTVLGNRSQLDLSGNKLSGGIPKGLLYGYEIVNLSRNSLDGSIPDPCYVHGRCEDHRVLLKVMDLSDNNLQGYLPYSLTMLPFLSTLWLQNNNLSGDISDLLGNMQGFRKKFTGIRHSNSIRLQRNLFNGDLFPFFLNSASLLEELDLSHNRFHMTHTPGTPNPLQLIFDHQTSDFAMLFEIRMRTIRLAGTNLLGLPLPELSTPSSLEVLDLASCNLSGNIPDSLKSSFPHLTSFNVSGNSLTGPIPENLFFFVAQVEDFNFSSNKLSGPIPSGLDASRFANNPQLCGARPLRRCSTPGHRMLVVLCTVLVGVVLLSSTFCTVYAYRWRKQHQQDKDLIATLLERESVILMSLRQLRTATDNFSRSSQIGVGGFGVVYAGQLEDGTAVAIKKSKRMGSPLDKQQFLNEVRILSQVNHIHLVRLLGCCLENKNALLVFEYVPNGTLEEHLQGKRGDVRLRLSWRQRLHIALQTAEALDYLHSAAQHPIFHRDVKSANILLDQHLNAKVVDFGLSKLVPKWATHVSTLAIQGTLGYIDPQYYTSFQLTSKSDVYSFGAVLLELISAKTPVGLLRIWEDASLLDLAISVRCKGDWGQFIDPVLLDTLASPAARASIEVMAGLAAKCLALRSRERPDMKEVRQQLQTLIDMHSDPCFDQLSNGMRSSSSTYRQSSVREQVEGMATPQTPVS